MIGLDIAFALIFAIAVDLASDWLTSLSEWLVGRAARVLPRKYRARYEQEWRAELLYRPRLLRILFALDLFRAARGIHREVAMRQKARRRNPIDYERLRRATDIVFASQLLIFAAPLMALIAIGVKLSSPGPILFRQRRYGLNGEKITVYKFRSMRVCEDDPVVAQATRRAPRLTPLGRILRKTSLDELPQIFNVLQGTMSVVGPRLHTAAHNEEYRKLVKGCAVRHKVRPGITGLAQIRGLRGEAETIEEVRERVKCDLQYLSQRSPYLDLKIIVKTLHVLWRDRNES